MKVYPTTVSSKGQVVIPAELRERLKLGKGARLTWREEQDRLVLIPMARLLDEIQGSLQPGPGEPSMWDELKKDRESARERESRR